MRNIITSLVFMLLINSCIGLYAQAKKGEQCGTMIRLTQLFERDPALKPIFTRQLENFNTLVSRKSARPLRPEDSHDIKEELSITIPVVFHIVLKDPLMVSDEQIYAQLETLNKNYSGSGEDSTQLPEYFKSIFGRSPIRFCLAQRNPLGEITNGITRRTTFRTSFSITDEAVKHAERGGTDLWDGYKYFNVWVSDLGNNLLGYSTFPNDGKPDEQGAVIDYRSLPGGKFDNYQQGKTLTHEAGHYFNLFHIWGDDDGVCTGSDFVEDTPNQSNATTGCPSGIKTDNCTPGENGILYQNYMDYSYDPCLLLFSQLQVERMTTALRFYRPSLALSNGCIPAGVRTLDAKLVTIDGPGLRVCTNVLSPEITFANLGTDSITTLHINMAINNETPVLFKWNGYLPPNEKISLTLPGVPIEQGKHTVIIFTAQPNSGTDENNLNDTLYYQVEYFAPFSTLGEGFEGNSFPPPGWDIVNPDHFLTWKKVIGISKSGNSSVMINNFEYANIQEQDYLRLPELSFTNIDSVFLTFQLAAASFTSQSGFNKSWDTLEVLLSYDCGKTYSILYKKWGMALNSVKNETLRFFEPVPSEWRKDSINLTPFINKGKFMLAFRNTTEYNNNIYLDDLSIRTQWINPKLKEAGFLVTPNPVENEVLIQFYPNPVNLTGIQLFSMHGQKLRQITVSPGQGAIMYTLPTANLPSGIYVIKAIFTDKVLTKKIIRR